MNQRFPSYVINRRVAPAGQVVRPQGLNYVGSSGKVHTFSVDCRGWRALSPAEKISRVSAFGPRDRVGAVRTVDRICGNEAMRLRPAGQADMTFSIQEANPGVSFDTSSGNATDSSGNTYDSGGNPTSQPPSSGGGGMTSAQQTALFNTIGGALNTTGSTIASIVQSNNQAQIAQLQTQAQQTIATLNAESQQATAAGNIALAQQRSQQAAQLQTFMMQYLGQQRPSNTGLYVVAGLVGLTMIGAIVYFVARK